MLKVAVILLALASVAMCNPQDINANLPNTPNYQTQQKVVQQGVQQAQQYITSLQAALNAANAKLAMLQQNAAVMEMDLDTMWLVLGAALVFLLLIGFTLVEASASRTTSLNQVLIKNLIVVSVVAIVWWSFGYGVAYAVNLNNGSANPFIGNGRVFMASDGIPNQREFANWVYSYAFAAFATVIATSSLTDRATITAYVIIAIAFSGGVYPVIVHWVWSANGWLYVNNTAARFASNGMIDWSGSGVVHMTAGFFAFVASYIAGPRLYRFDAEFNKANPSRFQHINKVYQGLGVLFLWVGWYGFTCVSTNLSGGRAIICVKVAANTTLAAGAGALIAYFADFFFGQLSIDHNASLTKPNDDSTALFKATDIRITLNGVIAGLVAVSAGVSVYEPWAAVVVGGLAGLIAVFGPRLAAYIGLDDPTETFSIFALSGLHGLHSVGWLAMQNNIYIAYNGNQMNNGIWYGGDAEIWGVQLFGAGAIFLWTLFWAFVVSFVLKLFSILRVSEEQEAAGLDITPEHLLEAHELEHHHK